MLPLNLGESAAHGGLTLEVDDALWRLAPGYRKQPAAMPLGDPHVGAEHVLSLGLLDRIPVAVVDSHRETVQVNNGAWHRYSPTSIR